MIPASTGQYVESGRDQGHTQLSIGNMAEIAQIAYSQGDSSVFQMLDNRLKASYEYTSQFQMNATTAYNTSILCCGCVTTRTVPSAIDIAQYRPVREIAYGYYVGVEGGAMPYTKDILTISGGDQTNPVSADNDNSEWGRCGSGGRQLYKKSTLHTVYRIFLTSHV